MTKFRIISYSSIKGYCYFIKTDIWIESKISSHKMLGKIFSHSFFLCDLTEHFVIYYTENPMNTDMDFKHRI